MSGHNADRNLLFGITALQNDFITRDALIAAMNAWAIEKHRGIGEILVERGDLDPADRDLLEPMIERRIVKHGDPARSLAALSSSDGVVADLRRVLPDPEIQASLGPAPSDPFATRMPGPGDTIPNSRYHRVREHAKGGLGVVFVARDVELGREVALKEIQDRHADHPESRARFVLEAEVTGGLEHPGIVPVYGLGQYPDGRPFYAMRFIKGDSLKDAIESFHRDERAIRDPGERTLKLQKLLRRFLDVCYAIDYAHSRGVLHRDLKPQNVMVGKYGETLVVDWGLAKAVGRSGDDATSLPEATLTPSSASGVGETLPGSVVGTPQYMSPEQAAGRLDLLGPSSDVYSLGATLYALLTGGPPIPGHDVGEILARVQRGDFPRPRAVAPWLDPALEAVCLKAMSHRPENRYTTPRALANDVELWIADEPVSAHREPFIRRARRWTRRNRTAVTSISVAVLVVVVMLGGYLAIRRSQRHRTDAAALDALAVTDRREVEAELMADLDRWAAAIAEAQRAEALLDAGNGSPSLVKRVREKLATLRSKENDRQVAITAEKRDRKMINDLDQARLRLAGIRNNGFDPEAMNEAFYQAFRAYGIDVGTLSTDESAARIRSSSIREELVTVLEEWADIWPTNVAAGRLWEIAEAADTEGNAGIRSALAQGDVSAIRAFVTNEQQNEKNSTKLRSAFRTLSRIDPVESLPFLQAIQHENPSDFWYNHDLAGAYGELQPPRIEESIRYYTAAVAIRPEIALAHLNLARALTARGNLDEAAAACHKAIKINRDLADAQELLGIILILKNDSNGAVAAYRHAIKIDHSLISARVGLAEAILLQGDAAGACEVCEEGVRIKPDFSVHRGTAGLSTSYASLYLILGQARASQGDQTGAVAACREAIRIKPDLAKAHCVLGFTLRDQGRFAEALENVKRGHEIGSKQKDWRETSAQWVQECQRLVDIDAKLPTVLSGKIAPRNAKERVILAYVCSRKALNASAARFYEESFETDPALAEPPKSPHRYNAACVAALAASESRKDQAEPSKADRDHWRTMAREWLRSDLSVWFRECETGPPQAPPYIVKTLAHWKADPDLASIREEAMLTKLPENEQKALRTLWADVEALRKKAEGKAKADGGK